MHRCARYTYSLPLKTSFLKFPVRLSETTWLSSASQMVTLCSRSTITRTRCVGWAALEAFSLSYVRRSLVKHIRKSLFLSSSGTLPRSRRFIWLRMFNGDTCAWYLFCSQRHWLVVWWHAMSWRICVSNLAGEEVFRHDKNVNGWHCKSHKGGDSYRRRSNFPHGTGRKWVLVLLIRHWLPSLRASKVEDKNGNMCLLSAEGYLDRGYSTA